MAVSYGSKTALTDLNLTNSSFRERTALCLNPESVLLKANQGLKQMILQFNSLLWQEYLAQEKTYFASPGGIAG